MGMNNFNPNSNGGNGNGYNSGSGNGNGNGSGTGGGIVQIGISPNGGSGANGQVDEDFDPNEFLINYNERYKNDAPTMFRDAVIQQTLSCLIGKFKPNALLVGPAGTGKTKIAEDIARRLATGDTLIPDQLQGYTVWELPLSNIVSGSSLVGEVERKAKNILNFAKDPANKVILFIDEMHMLVGESGTYEKIAQIMKPALARGDMKVIGATTLQESKDLIKDPAFNRRFTRLIVDELSKEQTLEILKQMQMSMFNHYKNRIALNDQVLREIIAVADEYTTIGSHRPDNAITLLDRSMADAYIHRKALEEKAKNDPNLAATLAAVPTIALSKSQMKETAMKLMTGNNKKADVDINSLKERMKPILGQDETIEFLLDTIERSTLELSIERETKPMTLLFTGNSGVGKTEIVKILAREMTGVKPITLNMTEYHDASSIHRIIGAPPGYVGSDSKTELPFDILESNPYQVILLDEFEKADKAVQRLFMSAFDEGYIKTSKGATVDFSKAIIIATTNAGHTGISKPMGFTGSDSAHLNVTDLSRYFDAELLNRFTKILNFNPITETLFRSILMDTYRRYVDKVKAAKPSYQYIPDTMDDATADRLTKENYVAEFGARHVKKIVKTFVEDTILSYKRNAPIGTCLTVPTYPASAPSANMATPDVSDGPDAPAAGN